MNDTNVPTTTQAVADAQQRLASALADLTPELRKAATYVIEHPNEIGIGSVREIAAAAGVKPNTLVRLARAIGFAGYEDLRAPFRDEIRQGGASFPDRARWLQSLARGGGLSGLYAEMVTSAIQNIEDTFAATDEAALRAAADVIVAARRTYVLGVGVNNMNARNFSYLADMAVDTVESIPRTGSTAIDDLARAGQGDVLLAMTCKPYRTEVIEAVALARQQGVTIIAISDSPASPIILAADHGFTVSAQTPQFFPSSVSILALLETLMAFVIADAPEEVITSIERFHARRHALGLYRDDPGES